MERGGQAEAGRRRWIGVGIGVAVVVIGLVVVTRRDGDGDGIGPAVGPRTPPQTVDAFFAAQAAGDCAALQALLTEASWSDGGRRSADEFRAQCEDALDGYRPDPGSSASVDAFAPGAGPPADGDRLEVTSVDQPGQADQRGSLVGEGGRWKVELDPVVLHLGRTPSETVAAYVQAYNTGDCDAMLDLLSQRAWSGDGQRSSDDFLSSCGDRATTRQASDEVDVDLPEATTTAQDAASATVAVRFDPPLAPAGDPPDSVQLVTDGLEWVLDANVARPGAEPLLLELTYRDLQARLLDEVAVGGRSCSGTDEQADVAGSIAGLARTYFECEARVSLLQYADQGAAAGAIDAVVAQLRDADNSSHEAGVPGNAAAVAVVGDCELDGCTAASVLQADGNFVVHVELLASDDVAAAADILQQQLDR